MNDWARRLSSRIVIVGAPSRRTWDSAASIACCATSRQASAAAALANATPDQLLALRKADDDFKSHMAELGVELEKIGQADRDSARKREAAVKDRTPAFLALLLTLGFFRALGFMMAHGLSKDTAGSEALLTMLGSLGTGFTMVLAYYFGSSAGSDVKNRRAKRTRESSVHQITICGLQPELVEAIAAYPRVPLLEMARGQHVSRARLSRPESVLPRPRHGRATPGLSDPPRQGWH